MCSWIVSLREWNDVPGSDWVWLYTLSEYWVRTHGKRKAF